jgi:hypothetical protein
MVQNSTLSSFIETTAVARLRPAGNITSIVGSGIFHIVPSDAISRDRQSWIQFRVKKNRVAAGSNTSTVTLGVKGGDEKESLRYETVKYGRESQENRTRERLRWQGPAAYQNTDRQTDRQTDPSSRQRGRPTKTRRNCQTVINIWSWALDGARHQDLLTLYCLGKIRENEAYRGRMEWNELDWSGSG